MSLRHAESCHDVMVTSIDSFTVCHAQDRACIMHLKRKVTMSLLRCGGRPIVALQDAAPEASMVNLGLSPSATIKADHTGYQGMIGAAGQGMQRKPRRGVPLELAGLVQRSAAGREVNLRHVGFLSGVCAVRGKLRLLQSQQADNSV